jgi:AhpD family alkylhydroperoxidase
MTTTSKGNVLKEIMLQETIAHTRIPAVPDAALGPVDIVEAVRLRRGGNLLNLDRMLLNSPAYAIGWNGFLGAVRNKLALDARLRELAICAVAVLNGADYELDQHAPEFLDAGGTQQQLDALEHVLLALDGDGLLNDLFNDAERATLALTREMTLHVKVSEACFERVQQALPDPQQQVELVGVIAAYNMVSRFLVALQVAPESSR